MLSSLCSRRKLPFIPLFVALLAACAAAATPSPSQLPPPQVDVLVDGLFAPIGMAALPDGGLLVAEEGTGERDNSAGVTLITADGQVGRLVSGLPSTRDAGDLAGVPLVSVAPDGATIYIGSFAAGHLWTLPLPSAAAGGLTLPDKPYTPDQLGQAMVKLNNVMLVNPFDLTFDPDGTPVVTDASGNGVAIENPDGTTRFFHRFDRLQDPTLATRTIEAVPTGITRVGERYLVALTGGCPYPAGAGQVAVIDKERNQRTLLDGLNMPIDVALGPDGTIWVLEFASFTPDQSCFTGRGYEVETGRLSRLAPGCLTDQGVAKDCSLETVLEGLNFPGAVLPMADGSLYISEVFPGRILHVTFGEPVAAGPGSPTPPETTVSGPETRSEVADPDRALRDLAADLGLQPNPGLDQREAGTPQAHLGQLLFFDPLLSGDLNISCATCHHPSLAMGDGRALPIGTGGIGLGPERQFMEQVALAAEASFVRQIAGKHADGTDANGRKLVDNPFAGQFVPRNSLTILNSALMPLQFWDGRVERYGSKVKTKEQEVNAMQLTDPLATQALFPVTSLHEMAGATLGGLAPQEIRRVLVERLRTNPAYVDLFTQAFGPAGDGAEVVTMQRVVDALAAFERRFIFTNAPWDAYLAGDDSALTAQQKRGALLFYGRLDPQINCAVCHSGDLMTDFGFHNLLVPQIGPGKGHGYTRREDWGRAGVTFDARDRYAFRTPSLRNVTLTAPYFHDGAYATLEAAVRYHGDIAGYAANYDPSANGVPQDLYSSLQPYNRARQWPSVAPELRNEFSLGDQDVADLVAFLAALTDPAATDLDAFLPAAVPSGLPLDPLPHASPQIAVEKTTPGRPADSQSLAVAESSANGEIEFVSVAPEVGLTFEHGAFAKAVYADMVAAMGGGLCWIDYDNDGWLDLYVVNSHAEDEAAYWRAQGGLPHNALFHNEGGRFEDVSAASGTDLVMRGNGCVAADLNGDGWSDLYITAYGPNALLWNNGDGTFTEGAAAAGVAAPEWSSAAVVADLNNDGLLDLFVGSYIDFKRKIPKPVGAFPQDYYGIPDRLYLNRGAASPEDPTVVFEEVTTTAGLFRKERALGAIFSDLDADGDLDLYIANDGHANRLYLNEPWPASAGTDPAGLGFRFVEVTQQADVGDTGSGMGVTAADYDGDGLLDLFVTNWERELN
ncbi:MAG: ScyD/ScyE family protein, partial [Caldilineaceae bacterium]|nr:ScyD/ScyE family protein [Caldilineaceae bacterium]